MRGIVSLGTIACILALMVFVAAKADAQGSLQGSAGAQFIRHFDRDKDGKVSQTEFPGPEDHFLNLDEDGDGYIDEDEAPSAPPPPPSFVERLDLDADGRISKAEFMSHFNQLDVNGDGYIDETEAPQRPPRPN